MDTVTNHDVVCIARVAFRTAYVLFLEFVVNWVFSSPASQTEMGSQWSLKESPR